MLILDDKVKNNFNKTSVRFLSSLKIRIYLR